jgi:hypothetical protein
MGKELIRSRSTRAIRSCTTAPPRLMKNKRSRTPQLHSPLVAGRSPAGRARHEMRTADMPDKKEDRQPWNRQRDQQHCCPRRDARCGPATGVKQHREGRMFRNSMIHIAG